MQLLTASRSHCLPKDQAENVMQQNEKLITELNETRAAMLSYKNMFQVIAD